MGVPLNRGSASRFPTALAAALLGLAACGGAEPMPEGFGIGIHPDSNNLTTDNGRSINGRSINGRSINGTSFTGLTVVSFAQQGVMVGTTKLTDVVLIATNFASAKGKISGHGFVGTVFTANLSDGTTLPVTVSSMAALAAPNADLNGYGLTYQTSTGAQLLCGLETDGVTPTLAVPVPGVWNYNAGVTGGGSYLANTTQFTFACRHFAVSKCVEMGYKPWLTEDGNSLAPYLATCVRVLRADYCGDGTSYTVDGTTIDIYDKLNIQTDAQKTWPVEAVWTPSGAACTPSTTVDRFSLSGSTTPTCYATLTAAAKTSCAGGGFVQVSGLPSSLIIDRYLK